MQAVYVHIPFCKKKCSYCSFFSVEQVGQIDRYLAALEKEMCSLAGLVKAPLSSLYIGGGTPSLLSEKQLSFLFDCLSRSFDLGSAEITVEINPGTIDACKARLLAALGVTRASIGIQSLNDSELAMLGRIHSADDALRTVTVMRQAGIPHLNVDIMFALPGQSMESLERTLTGVVGMPVDHVSYYCLHVEEETVLYQTMSQGEVFMADDDLSADMYEFGIRFLHKYGFEQYEISNFAQDGRISRHNMTYWNYDDFLGLGAGATSMTGERRWTTCGNINRYLDGSPQPDRDEEFLSPETQIAEAVMMGLRKNEGLHIPAFKKRFGIDLLRRYHSQVQELKAISMMETAGEWLRLTERGRILANSVLERFIP